VQTTFTMHKSLKCCHSAYSGDENSTKSGYKSVT